ncbi:MAG TPA: DUF6644 family protein [Burkholderiales bacterium]|nr:DUF6644 family protein [Burkholderiales bacterium]
MDAAFKQWLDSVCWWIDATPFSQAIQDASWITPAAQTVHILAIAALMASMLMINLRLTGLLGCDQPLAQVSARFSPAIWWALPVLLVSGAILVTGEPARVLKSNLFQIKMLLLISAILVTMLSTEPLKEDPTYWDDRTGIGLLVALLSVSLWVGIIFAGRWIAYF